MSNVKINFDYTNHVISEDLKNKVLSAQQTLLNQDGLGNDFLGWVDLPTQYDKDEFSRIKQAAEKIKEENDVLVVIGIGGSYLGARAVISALKSKFKTFGNDKCPQVIFAGHHMDPEFLNDLKEYLNGKNWSINVISKSGTTTEPAIAFRYLYKELVAKYGEINANARVYATTDKEKGALKELANAKNFESFVVPDNVGGRFSVLTPVGLLPIAVSGIDIDLLMQGAADEAAKLKSTDFDSNNALQYVAYRNHFYNEGKSVEILVNYTSKLYFFGEWWKQLFGESEGKDGKGLFPAADIFTTDLHSLGQFIQEGKDLFLETIINIEKPNFDVTITSTDDDLDGLNYLSGKGMDFVNKKALEATAFAHQQGGTPNSILNIESLNEFNLGALIYFFEFACGVSGYTLGVNPFDQPGVEFYKKEMFARLGKPGSN